MKATVDLDDALYRRLKMEAARRGLAIRELVADGVERVPETPASTVSGESSQAGSPAPWFGVLHGYAHNATGGDHDLAAIRTSIVAGRRRKRG